MEVKTKYNIGDVIEYQRLIEFGDKKKNHYVKAIGVIKSMLCTHNTILGVYFYLESGYWGGAIAETDVLCRLERVDD